MWQALIVAVIVGLAALYAVWRFIPAGWRLALATRFASASKRAGLVDAGQALELQSRLAKSGGCGACDSCGACGSSKPAGQGTGR